MKVGYGKANKAVTPTAAAVPDVVLCLSKLTNPLVPGMQPLFWNLFLWPQYLLVKTTRSSVVSVSKARKISTLSSLKDLSSFPSAMP